MAWFYFDTVKDHIMSSLWKDLDNCMGWKRYTKLKWVYDGGQVAIIVKQG